ncbi:MAG: rhodanese-like domain-containing protein [Chitinophagaceae bacterium]
MNIEKLIQENQGTIVDVRTPEEYMGGHVVGSVNIPLQEIGNRIEELKALKSPLILCCASGGRSGMADGFLKQHGFECCNAGSWLDVNYLHAQSHP